MFGIHAASMGYNPAFIQKDADTVCNRMYVALRPMPAPKASPIPPLRFLEESDMPMVDSMNAAKGVA